MSLQTILAPQGFSLVGVYVGAYQPPKKNPTDRDRTYVGMEVGTPSNFGRVETKIIQLSVNDSILRSGVLHRLEQYKDQMIALPVTIREWQLDNGKSGVSYNLSDDVQDVAQALTSQKPMAKAV